MNTVPACAQSDPELFASGHPGDHADAKKICADCPLAEVARCESTRDGLIADGYAPVGTWAGQLHGGTRKFRVGAR